MKVAVINFSGNVGKSTVAKHLLLPRIKDAEFISVESINSDEGDGDTVRGKQFGMLQEQLLVVDAAVIDVGASNVEEFIKLMQQYRGSHDDFDMFVIPAVKDGKQTKDTIATIEALKIMGVPAKKIRIVLNRIEVDDNIEEDFFPLFAYHNDSKAFTIKSKAAIRYSELYQRMRSYNTDIPNLMQHEQSHYKAKLKDALAAKNADGIEDAKAFISMRRLAEDAQENLNAVFTALVKA